MQTLTDSVSGLLQTVITVKCLESLYGSCLSLPAALRNPQKWSSRGWGGVYYVIDLLNATNKPFQNPSKKWPFLNGFLSNRYHGLYYLFNFPILFEI